MSNWTCATIYIKNLFDSDHVIKLFPIKNYVIGTPYKSPKEQKFDVSFNNSESVSVLWFVRTCVNSIIWNIS